MLSMSFTVRSVDEGFADALRWHLEPFHRATPEQHAFPVDLFVQEQDMAATPPPYSFFLATSFGIRHASLVDVLNHALWHINRALAERVRDFLLVHAGAVARNGVVLLPARMDSGKSSLIAALLETGFEYLSDEFGALDPVTAQAYPVPRPVSLGWDALRLFPGLEPRLRDREGLSVQVATRFVRPQDLGTGIGAAGHVRWLVFPRAHYEGPPRLSPMSSAQAVEELAATSFNLFRYSQRGVVFMAKIAGGAQAFTLEGGTPRERAALLADRLS